MVLSKGYEVLASAFACVNHGNVFIQRGLKAHHGERMMRSISSLFKSEYIMRVDVSQRAGLVSTNCPCPTLNMTQFLFMKLR